MWRVGDAIKRLGVPGIITAVETSFSAYYHLDNGTCGECINELLERDITAMARPKMTPEQKAAAKAAREAAKQAIAAAVKPAEPKPAAQPVKSTNGLFDAVRFCLGGYAESGEAYAQHALIWAGWITTYNGIVMYGHPIDTPMQAAPHFGRLLAALKATDNTAGVQITLLDQQRLSIRGKGFRTIVPCVSDIVLVHRTPPDAPVGALDGRMRDALEAMKKFANKRGELVMQSAVAMGNGFLAASDNKIAGMYWHGIAFPDLVVPADFVEAVLKVPKQLHSFGYAPDKSLTFYFADGSFIRTQLYAEPYADVASVIPQEWDNLQPVPETFFDALTKIEPFIAKDKSYVFFHNDCMSTDENLDTGTTVDCPGLLEAESGMDVSRLLKLKGHITHIDYRTRDKTKFRGENFCGILCNFVFEHRSVAAGFADYVEQFDAALAAGEDPAPHGYTEQNGYPVPDAFSPPTPAGPVEYEPEPEPAPASSGGWITP